MDGLRGDRPVSKRGEESRAQRDNQVRGQHYSPQDRPAGGCPSGERLWMAGWRPSSRGMGDGASLGTAPKPQRRWSQSGFCRSLRSPHEATWSLHVGTHQPEHALHIVRKTTVEAKLRSQFRGFLGSQKAICFLPTTRQTTRRMPTCANDNKIQVLGPSTHVGSKSALNHPFPTTKSLLARWAASGGPTQKESTTPNTLISSKLVPN